MAPSLNIVSSKYGTYPNQSQNDLGKCISARLIIILEDAPIGLQVRIEEYRHSFQLS